MNNIDSYDRTNPQTLDRIYIRRQRFTSNGREPILRQEIRQNPLPEPVISSRYVSEPKTPPSTPSRELKVGDRSVERKVNQALALWYNDRNVEFDPNLVLNNSAIRKLFR